MSQQAKKLKTIENPWSQMRVEAATAAAQEPILASFLHTVVLNHGSFSDALSFRLAQKLADTEVHAMSIREVSEAAYAAEPDIAEAALCDIQAAFTRDPTCKGYLEPFMNYKGFLALQAHRIAHWLWGDDRETLALYLQSRISELFSIDIHPAAQIGRGIFIDHGTGVVIGETSVVEDDVSIMQGVTLGGTGNETGDRHPKIRRGVLLGAGAKVLGAIEVAERAKVAAGSVVLKPVEAGCTVAGVPARPVGKCGKQEPAFSMDQTLDQTLGM